MHIFVIVCYAVGHTITRSSSFMINVDDCVMFRHLVHEQITFAIFSLSYLLKVDVQSSADIHYASAKITTVTVSPCNRTTKRK